MIFLARDMGREQPLIGLMDVRVKRNAFGRQVASFEIDLDMPMLEPRAPFHAIFIRAPLIESVGKNVAVLAKLDLTARLSPRSKAICWQHRFIRS